jgi:nucleoside-diphosphate-sugar epimerase
MTKLDEIATTLELEEWLSAPTEWVVDTLARLDGDILVLGVGGKMGPSLARMARRAFEKAGLSHRVIAVSRFSNLAMREQLHADGIETWPCDLTLANDVQKLPDAPNVVFMAGMKFGSTARPAATWAANCLAPALVCERFRESRIVAFSTGNIYGLTPVDGDGSREADTPSPVGEYAMSALGRERIFEFFSDRHGTRTALLRLNYACDLRYGVLVDLAEKVWTDEKIDLSMGHINTIWQGDANAMALCAFDQVASPACVLNITGAECISVRAAAEELGRIFGKRPKFVNSESTRALLSNCETGHRLLGSPQYNADELLQGVAAWIKRGGERLGKPTRYESIDGRF